ncbi:MAG: prolipoprotein diacylglyceryl transferase, partial [Planctomycetes bacterium]|nr:prolipoprotein diacylglyceryl transferase [Planctomycetota bacterium]
MHPHLWTVPVIGFKIGTYGLVMAVGFVIALLIARRRAKFAGLSPSGMTTLTLIGMASGLAGAPLMYFRHYGFFGGREIIGGV